MSLSEKDVTKIAKLARIRLEPQQIKQFCGELSGILAWVEMLQELNTENVPQMTSVMQQPLVCRDDDVTDGTLTGGNIPDDIVANAPDSRYGYFVVPKVVE